MPSDSGKDSNNPPRLLMPLFDLSDDLSGFSYTCAAFGNCRAPRSAFNELPLLTKLTVVVCPSEHISQAYHISHINPLVKVPLSLEEIHSRCNGSDSISILAELASLNIVPSYTTIDVSQ